MMRSTSRAAVAANLLFLLVALLALLAPCIAAGAEATIREPFRSSHSRVAAPDPTATSRQLITPSREPILPSREPILPPRELILLPREPTGGASPSTTTSRGARWDTLWIFDADFSDLVGDNAGWTSVDRSGTLGRENYWHKDTLRSCPRPEGDPGDSSWWCGKYGDSRCWRQPRGYGNDWWQVLERDFPLSEWSAPGDTVTLEFDQRYAMERHYDYGYVDLSDDGGASWTTVATFTNVGFMGAGLPVDWDHVNGHQVLDAGAFAGEDVRLRFRFESDQAYSSESEPDNPPQHSVQDGAWQLDNVEWLVNGTPVWSDDSESPGDNGWVHDDIPATGQTGVTFRRGQLGVDFFTGREGEVCFAPPNGTWMMAAVDSATGTMIDEQDTGLLSPTINIAGADHIIGEWTLWIDLPETSNDLFGLRLRSFDEEDCPEYSGGFEDEWGPWFGGPFWGTWTDDWDAFAGNDSLRFRWDEWNYETPADPHRGGIFLVRHRVAVLLGPPDPRTYVSADKWRWFNDWFVDDMAEALEDTARIRVRDVDGVASVTLLASNTGGAPFEAYACIAEDPAAPEWFKAPPPVNQMTAGSEVRYYFETMDGLGNTAVYPKGAPDNTLEMSVLPFTGSIEQPGLLLVDKHGALVPGEDRGYRHSSEHYYREALEILGYDFDVYDVEVPNGSIKSNGPDTNAMRYYDTQIWFFGDGESYLLSTRDQAGLIDWLADADEGAERNLLLAGDNVCWELVEGQRETLDFLNVWMGTEYLMSGFGDTLPVLRDATGGNAFMTHEDGSCLLRGGCPEIAKFDVITPQTSALGAEVVAEYEDDSSALHPAGVAYTHPVTGYRTIVLGLGLESLMHGLEPTGHYATGIADRADLLENIMDYFGRPPDGPGTSVSESGQHVTSLERAHPNPFNPVTTIEYGVASPGRVRIRVYDLAGRVVRTLVDAEADPGAYQVLWSGTTDSGHSAASGVYFIRMETEGFRESRKTVLLK